MKHLGFLVVGLGTSQHGLCLITECNRLSKDINISVFYETYDRIPIKPHFPLLQNFQAWTFTGPLIATCLKTAYLLDALPNSNKKFFYIWNLEWLYNQYQWSSLSNVYQNNNIELIARNDYHAELISKLWKKPSYILEDFNYVGITEIANRYGHQLSQPKFG